MAAAAELFIARLPATSQLEAVEAELTAVQRFGPFLQLLKSKCRELARSESCLLVSPTTAALHCPPYASRPPMTLWVMARAGYLSNGKVQEKLKKLGIKVLRRVSVSESVLQICYQFSLTARLAPKWNLISSWLVQGVDFLSTGRSHAVVLEVSVAKTEIMLSVSVSRVNFNFLQPSDLEVSVATLGAFLTDPHSVISETSIYQNRCVLLPNLSVGYVFSASHQLPSSPEFPTYDTIRLHWKKQHGMILPEKQGLFFQIFFKSNSRNFFSYPGCCVLKAPPIVVASSRDSHSVASCFVSDLHSRMPSLCGEPIRYSNRALTPLPLLQTAALPATSHPNLRVAMLPSRAASVAPPTSLGAGRGSSLIGRASALASGHMTTQSGHVTTHTGRQPSHVTTPQGLPSSIGLLNHSRSPSNQHQVSSQTPNTARIVPVFRHTQQPHRPLSELQPTGKKPGPVVPSFKPSRASARPQTVPTTPVAKTQRDGGVADRPSASFSLQSSGKRSSTETSLQPHKKTCINRSDSVAGGGGVPSSRAVGRPAHLQRVRPPVTAATSSEQTVPDLSDTLPDTESLHTSLDHHQQTSNGRSSLKKVKGGKKTSVEVDGVGEDIINKISKMRAPQLKKWLQESGVKCSGRKTKDELVRMAAEYVRDTGTTIVLPS